MENLGDNEGAGKHFILDGNHPAVAAMVSITLKSRLSYP
jgi:hypothetical protein